jgi:hypothetical protein
MEKILLSKRHGKICISAMGDCTARLQQAWRRYQVLAPNVDYAKDTIIWLVPVP